MTILLFDNNKMFANYFIRIFYLYNNKLLNARVILMISTSTVWHIVYFISYKSIFSVPIPNYLSKEVMDRLHTLYLHKLPNNDNLTKYKHYINLYILWYI